MMFWNDVKYVCAVLTMDKQLCEVIVLEDDSL